MNILITGGAGFIGSHTTRALVAEGHHLRILDVLDPQIHGENPRVPSAPEIEFMRGDVRNSHDVQAALQDVEAVYHFASFTGVGQSMYDLRRYVDTNCTGTGTLLEALIKKKHPPPIKRFVLSSSRAVYGEGTHACEACGLVYPSLRNRLDLEKGRFHVLCPSCGNQTDPVPSKEDRPLLPVSVYGWTKKAQEEMCQLAAKIFGLPVTILRYFNVYGSGQSVKNPYTGVVSIFFGRIMAGEPIFLYEHGTPLRDFVHISDVVRANCLALDADLEPGTCVNVGTGDKSSIVDIAQALAKACQKEPQLEDRGEFRVGDIHACYAELNRANHRLGYRPTVSLEDGLKEFVVWAKNQKPTDLYEKTVHELERYGLFGRSASSES